MPSATVPGFLPSTSGFRFPNAFPHVPVRRIGIPGVVSLPIGDASNGLRGGMAFAARDDHDAGRPPPPDAVAPGSGRSSTSSWIGCSTASICRSGRRAPSS
jgi:hypothetical protein